VRSAEAEGRNEEEGLSQERPLIMGVPDDHDELPGDDAPLPDDDHIEPAGDDQPWKQEIETLRRTNEEGNLRIMAVMGELMKQGRQPASAEPAPNGGGSDLDMLELAQQAPALLPQAIESIVSARVKAEGGVSEKRIMEMIAKRDAGKELSARLQAHYADDIRDRGSEIVAATPEARALVEPFLDPAIRGTDQANQIAYFVAAGMNPSAVSKREVSRQKSREEARSAAAVRSSAMGGIGGGGRGRAKEPEIGPEDLALAERLGVNLSDEKVRARVLGYKKTEKMVGIRDGVEEIDNG
jgi:hypothetical protein